ncbi:hypothetical protein [Caballeronia sp. NCTM5]|uniref:hypothetical protein n=1 Tax=Caballeronia sp. NCTM5 TaxID=2921755 RepID=UPI0020279A42|nr:hypothetical protein [Caballeronia sp. NCTM5]
MTDREKVLTNALLKIIHWPDSGSQYGQKNIKRFAREQLDYAARFVSEPEHDEQGAGND